MKKIRLKGQIPNYTFRLKCQLKRLPYKFFPTFSRELVVCASGDLKNILYNYLLYLTTHLQ